MEAPPQGGGAHLEKDLAKSLSVHLPRSHCSREFWRECAGWSGRAGPSMLLGPDFPSRWLSMGDFHQEGSPLSGRTFPLPGVLEL